MLDALADLRAWYRDRGGELSVRRGDPTEILPDLRAAAGSEVVLRNRDSSGLARERDARPRVAGIREPRTTGAPRRPPPRAGIGHHRRRRAVLGLQLLPEDADIN